MGWVADGKDEGKFKDWLKKERKQKYLGSDVSSVSHQDGNGRCVSGSGGQVQRAVPAMIPQIDFDAVRFHVLGQPGHQVNLNNNNKNK